MEKELFTITTRMEKEDYRQFLYIAAFLRNKMVIPFIIILCVAGSGFISFSAGKFEICRFIIWTIFMFFIEVAVICIKVERRNRQRIKTDKTGTFDTDCILHFFEHKMIMETEANKSYGELMYEQFYGILESRKYIIFYITINQASLIRKKDVDNLEEFVCFLKGRFEKRYKKV